MFVVVDRSMFRLKTLSSVVVLSLALSGCNTLDRLQNIGKEPSMSPVQNPTQAAGYQPVSLPMPEPQPTIRNPNSLWQKGSRSFFKDQRANDVGDLLTVLIEVDDEAQISNTSTRARNNSESGGFTNLFGLESQINSVLPDGTTSDALVGLNNQSSNSGTGKVNRSEAVNLKVAATVTQKLPNGNLVILGRQEIRVNYELRELQITGIVRPQDITVLNTISYEKIAEARIAYGGKGHISDVQQPRYGQQVLDAVLPF